MPKELVAVLEEHRGNQDEQKRFLGSAYKDNDLVFAMADGSPVKPWNFGSAVANLIRGTGVTGVTLHGLRDTHGSLLAESGTP